MRALALLAAAMLALTAAAQEKAPAPRKKPAPTARQVVHKKPTPQQLRKFDELEKKREAKTK